MDAFIDGILDFSFELLILFRLLLALLLGGAIGIEREYYDRPAGFRTHILVSVGAALVMTISIYGFDGSDPARLAAQVISGIGFLGAGAILQGDKNIKGLTTAATLWVSAMIGLAAGNGFYFGAISSTLVALVVLIWFRKFEKRINRSRTRIYLTLKWDDEIVSKVFSYIKENDLVVLNLESKHIKIKKEKYIKLLITFEKNSSSASLNKFSNQIQLNHNPLRLRLVNY